MTGVHKDILSFLENDHLEHHLVDRLITSAFVVLNGIEVDNNRFVKDLIIKDKQYEKTLNQFVNLFQSNNQRFTFESLINIFEFVISPADKEINGAVYTPQNIRTYIIKETSHQLTKTSKIGDIACGCGGFLIDYAIFIHQKFNKSFKSIFKENLFGVDITNYSITRTKIILSLLAISEKEDEEVFEFNLFVGNSLAFDWFETSNPIKKNNGFDIIVGNPPYVGSTNIDDQSRDLLKNWSVTKTGKADLYIPFFEIGMHWLKPNGILGYITVNTFYKSINGRAVRAFFSQNKYDFRLIDFGGEQVFNGRSTYTCICLISKKEGQISFTKAKSTDLPKLNGKQFTAIPYKSLNQKGAWLLNKNSTEKNIRKIEQTGQRLGDLFPIKNGFATLRNKIYLFKPIGRENGHYLVQNETKIHKIETAICRDAIKPNVLKSENQIDNLKEKLIFPYQQINSLFEKGQNRFSLIDEKTLRNKYNHAYDYLNEHKSELAERDKGKKTYPAWYAFGRTQALNIQGKKLLFPYISNEPYFVYTDDEDLLFYNGYAIISDSQEQLLILQKLLTSSVFWYYIKHTSKPYANGYFSLAKNYIKNFGVCKLSKNEIAVLSTLKKKKDIDAFFINKYSIII